MERVRKNFCERDQLARHLGIELLELSPGHATARMEIKPFHLNGADSVHGGAIFSLADFAFAAACNTHGTLAVAINATIAITRAVSSGVLTATAREITLNPKLGLYEVAVRDQQDEIIAMFQGLAYRKSKPLG